MTTDEILEIIRNYTPHRRAKISLMELISVLVERGKGAEAWAALGERAKETDETVRARVEKSFKERQNKICGGV